MPKTGSLFAEANSEFQLVASCCRWPVDPSALGRCLSRPLQWQKVLFLANRHGVTGLVAHALAGVTDVPRETQQALRDANQKILLKNLAMLRNQVQLRDLLQHYSVPFAILKGTPLAMQAYGNLALRQSKDIDLLVGGEDVDRVDQLLRDLNFKRTDLSLNLTADQRKLWARSIKHYTYIASETGVVLELHWRTRDNRHLEGKSDPLENVEQILMSPGVALPVLPQEDLLLDLCVHGAGHAWFRLKWLADVGAMLHHFTPAERSELLGRSRRAGLERPVLQAMHLCEHVFGQSLLTASERPSRPVRTLIRIATDALLEENITAPSAKADFVPRRQALARVLLRTGWRYRTEELRLMMTSPADWQQVNLPQALSFLYPVLRVPLWIKRRLRRPEPNRHSVY